jgi:DNA repair protein RadC
MPAPPRTIDGVDAAVALFAPGFDGVEGEWLQIAYLGEDRRLLHIEAFAGGAAEIELPLRDIVARALALHARALVLAHNHPSGDPQPSAADIRITRQLHAVTQPLGIALKDHLIVANGRWTSFYDAGLL